MADLTDSVSRRDKDGEYLCSSAYSTYNETDMCVTRGVPHLQILKIPQPRHAIPHKPRMLPYHVRIVCR
jgi:hypothetical protein